MGKITIIDCAQGSQEWLDARKGLITCSNAMLLIEKGKRACLIANEDAAERITPNGNFYAERGHALEHEIREEFNAQLATQGLELRESGILLNSDFPDAGYSTDGLVVPKNAPAENYLAIIEIKAYNDVVERTGELATIKRKLHEDEYIVGYNTVTKIAKVYVGKHAKACQSYDNVPVVAQAQIQMELLISQAPKCYLILYNPDAEKNTPKTKSYLVYPDEKLQKILREKLSQKLS